MTTIATDGVTIAADSLAMAGHRTMDRSFHKLVVAKNEDGSPAIYGMAGPSAMQSALVSWFADGFKRSEVPAMGDNSGWTLLIVDAPEQIRFRLVTSECPYPWVESARPLAIGAGRDEAVALMCAGFDPVTAINVIIKHELDYTTGGTVHQMNIKEALGIKEPGLRAVKG